MFREIFSQADHYLQFPSSGETDSHARFQNVVDYIKKLRFRYDAYNLSRNLEKKVSQSLFMPSLFKNKSKNFFSRYFFFNFVI